MKQLLLATALTLAALPAWADTAAPLHYAPNSNFDGPGGSLDPTLTGMGFNLFDVNSPAQLAAIGSAGKGLIFLGLCNGADTNFQNTVEAYSPYANVFGFYLEDEPVPSSCSGANLEAEAAWIHANVPGAKTFIVLYNKGTGPSPVYYSDYNQANVPDLDYAGLDPYPIRIYSGVKEQDWSGIPNSVTAAIAAGYIRKQLIPVYQTFGGSVANQCWPTYLAPTNAQLSKILTKWGNQFATRDWDYAYSFGSQCTGEVTLQNNAGWQGIMTTHNGL